MTEDVRPDEKVKITVEVAGPRSGADLRKIMEELRKVAKSQGYDVEHSREKR